MAGIKPRQLETICWNCGTIQRIGNPCGNCKALITKPIADTPLAECPRCKRNIPVGIRCPWCGDKRL